jgi:hypothetical protein
MIWRFLFPFLFIRNWHTGQLELSRPRVSLFFGGLFLLVLALCIVSVLSAPTVYVGTETL